MRHKGFTLTELLVVVAIILLVSAVTLPTVIFALTSRQVGESARILQAALVGARDAAIRHNEPRGIRLLCEQSGKTVGNNVRMIAPGQVLTASRFVPIEPGPDIVDSSQNGSATFPTANTFWDPAVGGGQPPAFPFPLNMTGNKGLYPFPNPLTTDPAGNPRPKNMVLMIVEAVFDNSGLKNPPANWFNVVRIGDRLRFGYAGHVYTVVGPMTLPNPEGFVNDDHPAIAGNPTSLVHVFQDPLSGQPVPTRPQFLFLVNGVDDDGDGFVDNGLDGIDQAMTFVDRNNNPLPTPPPAGMVGYPAPDTILMTASQASASVVPYTGEWSETEAWMGSEARLAVAAVTSTANPPPLKWTLRPRPVPSPGGREAAIAGGACIDLTTWDTTKERSRLPVDPFSGNVDILVDQAGKVIPNTYYSSPASKPMGIDYYHFWICERRDLAVDINVGATPQLPIPLPPNGKRYKGVDQYLLGDGVVVSLNTKTGQVLTSDLDAFDWLNAYTAMYDPDVPFYDAEQGAR